MLLNDWINHFGLLELKISNRCYTWSNNQESPIMVSLDRLLVSTTWDQHFLISLVKTLPRAGSDHTPLLLNTRHHSHISPKLFSFEKWWLDQDDFVPFITKWWSARCPHMKPIDIWQFKVCKLRQKIQGWNNNIESMIKKYK